MLQNIAEPKTTILLHDLLKNYVSGLNSLCSNSAFALFVSRLASILGHLYMKTDSLHSTHTHPKTICIVSLYKRVIPSPLLWISTQKRKKKMLLWPTKALLEIILYDLRPFGMEGIYCFDLIKAEKLIWHPVVKETNSHTKENSCDGIIQTIQVTLERKKRLQFQRFVFNSLHHCRNKDHCSLCLLESSFQSGKSKMPHLLPTARSNTSLGPCT